MNFKNFRIFTFSYEWWMKVTLLISEWKIAHKCTIPLHRAQMYALIGGNLVHLIQKVIRVILKVQRILQNLTKTQI